ncbi:MAG: TIGR02647 family protein [Uliginosibacterium sp.]|jgi:uncharacterized protein (TIGR02647 family)|nr:TIGR02647 family protein [Uliginosibacterium sp.]MBK9615369.1 TIGR02647 family protein [Uliginosibacterium sp.]
MPFTADLVEELNTLLRFDLATSQQGIKIHKTADAGVIEATQRLHGKGLITQVDGGYLTSLGRDTAERAQILISILTSEPRRSM